MRRWRFLTWGLVSIGIGIAGGIRRLVIQTPAREVRELVAIIISLAFVAVGLVLIGLHFAVSGRSPDNHDGQGPGA